MKSGADQVYHTHSKLPNTHADQVYRTNSKLSELRKWSLPSTAETRQRTQNSHRARRHANAITSDLDTGKKQRTEKKERAQPLAYARKSPKVRCSNTQPGIN